MTPAAAAALSTSPALPVRGVRPPARPGSQPALRPGIHPSVRAAEGERLVVLPPHEVPRGAKVLGVVVALPDLRQQRPGAVVPGLRAVPSPSLGSGPGTHPAATRPLAPAARPRPVDDRELRPGLVLHRTDRTLLRDGETIVLTRREFDLLDHLTARPRRVLSRSTLLIAVWGAAVPMETRTVDVHVLRLRRKLGAEHAGSLETLRGMGYRWTP